MVVAAVIDAKFWSLDVKELKTCKYCEIFAFWRGPFREPADYNCNISTASHALNLQAVNTNAAKIVPVSIGFLSFAIGKFHATIIHTWPPPLLYCLLSKVIAFTGIMLCAYTKLVIARTL